MKIFKFLQGLVGFGNLRFAEIKSCPSASPTYELRKVEISTNIKLLTFPITLYPRYNPILFKTSILKVIFQTTVGEKNIKKTNILLFSADIDTYKLTFVSFFYVFFAPSPKPFIKKQQQFRGFDPHIIHRRKEGNFTVHPDTRKTFTKTKTKTKTKKKTKYK